MKFVIARSASCATTPAIAQRGQRSRLSGTISSKFLVCGGRRLLRSRKTSRISRERPVRLTCFGGGSCWLSTKASEKTSPWRNHRLLNTSKTSRVNNGGTRYRDMSLSRILPASFSMTSNRKSSADCRYSQTGDLNRIILRSRSFPDTFAHSRSCSDRHESGLIQRTRQTKRRTRACANYTTRSGRADLQDTILSACWFGFFFACSPRTRTFSNQTLLPSSFALKRERMART